jgi:hypothetical protein
MKNALKIGFLSVFCVLFLVGAAHAQAIGATAQYVPAVTSNSAAIPGRLSSDQMKAIFAAGDEENRRAFSDLVQQTSAVPSALLSIQEGIRQKYPRMGGTDNCRGGISELQSRLGPSLTPKQIADIEEMNRVLMGCAGQYFAFAPSDSRKIVMSAYRAIEDVKGRQQQIDSAKSAILQVEAALNAGDLTRANQLFHGLAASSSQPTFAQTYLQQTQGLRQDLDKRERGQTEVAQVQSNPNQAGTKQGQPSEIGAGQNATANSPKKQPDNSAQNAMGSACNAAEISSHPQSTPTAQGPFGFKRGMTREQITKLVGKNHVGTAELLGVDHLDDDVMVVNRAPVPNPAIETYWLTISPEDGLLKVGTNGIDVETDSFGTQLRTAYRNALAAATRKYGKPDDGDPVMTDGCIQNPKNDEERSSGCVVPDGYLGSLNNAAFGRFWTHLAGKNSPSDGVVGIHIMVHLSETRPFDPRIAASVFRATGLVIKSGEGYVTQEYDFAGFQEYLDAQKAEAALRREAADPGIRYWEPWQTASQIRQIVEEEKRQRQSYAEYLTKNMAGEIRWGVTGPQSEILAGIVTANPLSDQTCSQLAAGSPLWKEMFLKRFRFEAVLDKNESLKVHLIKEEGGFSVPITALPDVDRNSLEQTIHTLSIAARNGTQ